MDKAMVDSTDLDVQVPIDINVQPFRGPFARWPRTSDAVLAVIFFCLTTFVTFEGPDDTPLLRSLGDIPIWTLALFVIANGALFWRRDHPLIVLAIMLTTVSLTSENIYGMMVAVYGVGRYGKSDRQKIIGVIGTLLVIGLIDVGQSDSLTDIIAGMLFTFLFWIAGRQIGDRGAYLNLLRERATSVEREQTAQARRAVAEERTRIARELHDVVAHRVSMMTVQAGAAKTVARTDPEGAVKAMSAVETGGRQALEELRHLLGVLRPDSETTELAPQSGIDDVPRLVEQFSEAGLPVTLDIKPLPQNLPASIDLSVYRIIQEALTNVLKHAGPNAQADVKIKNKDKEIIIVVDNDGQRDTILPGAGHGIAGMRERTQLLGGHLTADPQMGGGFRVTAHFPLRESRK